MSRLTAFDVIGEVRESLITESLEWLDTTASLAIIQKKESPLLRFMRSGWGVAVICAVVSLSVLGGIIWAGQKDPLIPAPPIGTSESEVNETQNDPNTEGQTEAEANIETVAETQTEAMTEVVTEAPTEAETEALTDAETAPPEPVDVWDGSVATSFASGKGRADDPYLITSAAELAYLAQSVNGGQSYKNRYFFLTSNIDLNGLEFTPIGTLSKPFSGVFDGRGHTISGLSVTTVTVEKDATHISYGVAGLFGHVKNGKLANIHLNAPTINLQSTVSNHIAAGLLCGRYTVKDYSDSGVINTCLVTDGEIHIVGENVVYVGGILGCLDTEGRFSSISLNHLESHVTINVADSQFCFAGGIAGSMDTPNGRPNNITLQLIDFCCYTDISSSAAQSPQYIGTVGYLLGIYQSKALVKNGHSELRFAGDIQAPEGYNENDKTRAYVIANTSLNYVFENLSGSLTAENRISNQARWSESVSDILPAYPQEDALDKYIWDLSDIQKPNLIFPWES